ncbi:MAG: glycosyl hydrolase 115 family protein, partial [Planctomycetota bacterium]
MKQSLALLFLLMPGTVFARGVQEFVTTSCSAGDVKLVWEDLVADVYVSRAETSAVRNAARLFVEDVERVSGRKPAVKNSPTGLTAHAVIVGTLERSAVIKDLVAGGKIDVSDVEGKWETYLIEVVANPLPGVERGLVIAGSDRRGAIYGMFDVSENMGVSPWYWFADVHPEKQKTLVVKKGTYREGPPSVKYRGIFINDEMWGIRPWAQNTYAPDEGQGLGPKPYRRIFEMLLRLKANHIWPAMHRGTIPFNYYEGNK